MYRFYMEKGRVLSPQWMGPVMIIIKLVYQFMRLKFQKKEEPRPSGSTVAN